MSAQSEKAVTALYKGLLGRSPESASLQQYVGKLDSGFLTTAQVASDLVASADFGAYTLPVARLYTAAFGRLPDPEGLAFWVNVRRQGADTGQIAKQFLGSDEFASLYGSRPDDTTFLTALYQNVLGRSPDTPGLMYWKGRLAEGESRSYVLDSFAQSPENRANADLKLKLSTVWGVQQGTTPTADELAALPTGFEAALAKIMSTGGSGPSLTLSGKLLTESPLNDGTVDGSLTLMLTGGEFAGAIGAALGKVTGAPAGLTARLVKTGAHTAELFLDGVAKAHASINSTKNISLSFTDKDFSGLKAADVVGATASGIALSFIDLPPVKISNDIFAPALSTTATFRLDLQNDVLTVGGKTVLPESGSWPKVSTVDLRQLVAASVSVVGDNAVSEVIHAAPGGGRLQAGGGDDILHAAEGVDRIVFAKSAADNGVDRILGFELGAGKDVLDFTAFLNSPQKSSVATVDASVMPAKPITWTNGQILVVAGTFAGPADVAALFDGAVFAEPTASRKAVVITADLTGDASVWFVTNQADVTHVTADEVELVATMADINNLQLVGFNAGNFA